jgi:hypothetical protein
MVKLQKTSPQLRSTRHLSNPFDCILKRIWELASFGGFCCSFCMSLFCICPRGFYSCNLDIWSPSLYLQLGCGMENWSHAWLQGWRWPVYYMADGMSLIRSPAWWCEEPTMNYLRASIEDISFAQEELYSNLSDLLLWLF